ncbi:MAG: DUF3052 family protein [Acidimicrobiales bacterium]|nr:DUF3052 family protein [Acidimicrobiales bacterium]
MDGPAGYSGTPLPAKLGMKPGMEVAMLHAPEGIRTVLGDLPQGVQLREGLRRDDRVDMVIGFVTERDHLVRNIGWIVQTLPPDGAFWVAWPKKASKVSTDMSDQVVRDIALPMGWVDTKVCAIDSTWSGLKLVLRKELR